MMFGFGFVTIAQGLVRSMGGILTTRFFLGVFEATMFPGCSYLIAMSVYSNFSSHSESLMALSQQVVQA